MGTGMAGFDGSGEDGILQHGGEMDPLAGWHSLAPLHARLGSSEGEPGGHMPGLELSGPAGPAVPGRGTHGPCAAAPPLRHRPPRRPRSQSRSAAGLENPLRSSSPILSHSGHLPGSRGGGRASTFHSPALFH